MGAPTFPAFVGSGQTEIGMLDFSNLQGRAGDLRLDSRSRLRRGYDGWMEDYGEYVPPDAVAANGMTGAEMHNYYPLLYHRGGTATRAQAPSDREVRPLGLDGVHPYAQIVWSGDPSTEWGFTTDSPPRAAKRDHGALRNLELGLGHRRLLHLHVAAAHREATVRWIQFGAVSGVMRTKAEGIGVARDTRPQVWEGPVLGVWRRYAKLRTQLYPYLVRADRSYRKKALPIMRHLALAYRTTREPSPRTISSCSTPISLCRAGDRAGRDEPERVPTAWTLGRLLGLSLVRLRPGQFDLKAALITAGLPRPRRRGAAGKGSRCSPRSRPSCRSWRRRSTRSRVTVLPTTRSFASRTATGSYACWRFRWGRSRAGFFENGRGFLGETPRAELGNSASPQAASAATRSTVRSRRSSRSSPSG